jgi:DNA-binding GntR family transcriptional regulator
MPTGRSARKRSDGVGPASTHRGQGNGHSKLDWQLIWDIAESDHSGRDPERPSRNATTYTSIKRMILAGQVGPGYKLVHDELADFLRVSRTPVREALERLYQEGFVTRLPRRGFYVAGITRDEAFDLYGTREALELFALQVTLKQGPLSRVTIDRLWRCVRKYEEFTKTQALTERIIADVLFHLNLAELSGNRYLVRLLAQTFERLALKRRHEGYRYIRNKSATVEHGQLMDALIHYDKRTASYVLRTHILSARDALLSQLYEVPDPLRAGRPSTSDASSAP